MHAPHACYAGVADSIESDVDNLLNLFTLFNVAPRGLFLTEAATVAKRELALECDYRYEARSQRRFAALLVASPPSLRDTFQVRRDPQHLQVAVEHAVRHWAHREACQQEGCSAGGCPKLALGFSAGGRVCHALFTRPSCPHPPATRGRASAPVACAPLSASRCATATCMRVLRATARCTRQMHEPA
jgi:ABC1 atypical kinase-like domain